MTDIKTIREALEKIASGTEDIEPPYRVMPPEDYRRIASDALPILDRLAARVGEDWCFDMQKAPKDGTPLWLMATNKTSHEGAWKVCGNSIFQEGWYWAPYAYGGVGPISVMAWHTLPPPPETDDE